MTTVLTRPDRSEHGDGDVEHLLHEIAELDDLVERGPHWDTLIRAEIHRINHVEDDGMTVERARQR